MGDNNPKNPLDEFWEQLGDKKKKYVRSYRSDKRNIQNAEGDEKSTGDTSSNSSKRGS
jgi:hypothetical protein